VAEELLRQNASLGDGTFLVRPSETFVGAYSLSFLRKGEVSHYELSNNMYIQYTSKSRTIRYSNGHLSDTFWVRLSNGPAIKYSETSITGQVRLSKSDFRLRPVRLSNLTLS
jgi:hypothetical protein